MNRTMRAIGRLAAVVAVALILAGVGGRGADAETAKFDGHGTKAAFKKACEANVIDGRQGQFLDSKEFDTVTCVYGDGSKSYCDQQGDNCGYKPPAGGHPVPEPEEPWMAPTGENEDPGTDGGTDPVVKVEGQVDPGTVVLVDEQP